MAKRDLEEHIDYLKHQSESVAHRFLDAIEDTFDFLSRNSEVGQRCEFVRTDMAEIRVWPIHGCRNQLVFYRALDDGIEVVRVFHGARDIELLFAE
jgi:toxin ParE1/3/4